LAEAFGNEVLVQTIFDIGMYDASDTEYYLSQGHRVVAIEANSELIARASKRFSTDLAENRLVLVHAALSDVSGQEVTLHLSGDDLGSSSLFEGMVASRSPSGNATVKTVDLGDMISTYGCPYFMKVDIEGADRFAVLSLQRDMRPEFVSFEAGEDREELIGHLESIGFRKFKAINQTNFLELARQNSPIHRVREKAMRLLGYKSPKYVRAGERFFLCGHSSGPVPWKGDGKWTSAESLLARWRRAEACGEIGGWYDIHAA